MIQFVKLLRAPNAVPPLLWLLIGYYAGGANKIDGRIVTMFIGILLLNFFATLQNDVNDLVIDSGSGRKTALTLGKISQHKMNMVIYFLLISALLVPLLLGYFYVAFLLALYAVVCFAYNAKPLQLSRRPISSFVTLAICFSTLPAIYGINLSGASFNKNIMILLTGGFLFRISLSVLKDYKDYAGDKRYKKDTFLIKYGSYKLKVLSLAAYSIGAAMIVFSVILITNIKSELVLLLVITAVYSFSKRMNLRTKASGYELNNYIFHRLLLFGVLFEAGVWICFYT